MGESSHFSIPDASRPQKTTTHPSAMAKENLITHPPLLHLIISSPLTPNKLHRLIRLHLLAVHEITSYQHSSPPQSSVTVNGNLPLRLGKLQNLHHIQNLRHRSDAVIAPVGARDRESEGDEAVNCDLPAKVVVVDCGIMKLRDFLIIGS